MKPTEIHEFNLKKLKENGLDVAAQPAYKVVRNLGDLQRATTWDGVVVERKEFLWVEAYGLIKTCPYELHFVYETSSYGWGLYCTCGSIAGVAGTKAYSKILTPTGTGLMVVCVRHSSTKNNVGIGRHADESTE